MLLPDQEDNLRILRDLLKREHSEAKAGARTWAGRVVVEPALARLQADHLD